MMTRKARALGMNRTIYKNASGLPNDQQITTARDQSILGRAVQERFPKYYKYFQTRSFTFRGQSIGNHNRLLGRVEGVDGIKTGYIRASGFNLVTSLHRGNRYMVAVVMGGSSAGSRDARMRELLSQTVTAASTKRTAPMVAESHEKSEPKVAAKTEAKGEAKIAKVETKAAAKVEAKVAAKVEPSLNAKSDTKSDGKDQQRFAVASATSTTVRLAGPPPARMATGSNEPIRPVLVRTVSVKPGSLQAASPAPAPAFVPVQSAAPAKVQTPKAEPVKAEPESAPATIEIARIEPPTEEVATADVAKPVAAKPVAAKPIAAKSNSKFDSAQSDTGKAKLAKAEVAKAQAPAAVRACDAAPDHHPGVGHQPGRTGSVTCPGKPYGYRRTVVDQGSGPQRLDDPGRCLHGRAGSQAAAVGDPEQGIQGGGWYRSVYRIGGERWQHVLPGAFRRLRQGQGRSRVQDAQA